VGTAALGCPVERSSTVPTLIQEHVGTAALGCPVERSSTIPTRGHSCPPGSTFTVICQAPEGRHKSSPGRKSWVPSATISRPTWAPWKMQSVVFLPEKMLPSPHKPEFQSRTRAPPCCQRVGTSINNLYFRRRIHHASRYFSNLDLFFRLPGNSFSDFIRWITLTGNTYHAFSGTT